MSAKSVKRSTAKQTAKAKSAAVSDHLQRMVQALPEPPEAPPASRGPEAPEKAFRSNTLDRMAEHRDFAGRVSAMTVAIQRDHEEHGGGLVPDLLHALEDLAHAEYSLVAGNMSAIVELQAGRGVTS